MKKTKIEFILEILRGNNIAQGNICMPWYNKAVPEGQQIAVEGVEQFTDFQLVHSTHSPLGHKALAQNHLVNSPSPAHLLAQPQSHISWKKWVSVLKLISPLTKYCIVLCALPSPGTYELLLTAWHAVMWGARGALHFAGCLLHFPTHAQATLSHLPLIFLLGTSLLRSLSSGLPWGRFVQCLVQQLITTWIFSPQGAFSCAFTCL